MVTRVTSPNVTWQEGSVTREARAHQHGHRGATLWLTGLSGSGKSTVARMLEQRLHQLGCVAYVLDGDNVRHGLSSDLGFSEADRRENIRRVGEVAKLFTDSGALVLCAFISPYRADRQRLRELIGEGDFVELYVRAPLAVCEARDPKGLYRKARAGTISDFTGLSAPYEEPTDPELVLDTEIQRPPALVDVVVAHLRAKGLLAAGEVARPDAG